MLNANEHNKGNISRSVPKRLLNKQRLSQKHRHFLRFSKDLNIHSVPPRCDWVDVGIRANSDGIVILASCLTYNQNTQIYSYLLSGLQALFVKKMRINLAYLFTKVFTYICTFTYTCTFTYICMKACVCMFTYI